MQKNIYLRFLKMISRCFYSTIQKTKVLNSEKLSHIKVSNITENLTFKTTEQVKNNKEVGGPKGPEPTRYGDWEQKGRVTDF